MEEWFVHHDYVRCMKAEWYSLAPGISMLPKDNRSAFTDTQFRKGLWGPGRFCENSFRPWTLVTVAG
jgi:hypothetical protein